MILLVITLVGLALLAVTVLIHYEVLRITGKLLPGLPIRARPPCLATRRWLGKMIPDPLSQAHTIMRDTPPAQSDTPGIGHNQEPAPVSLWHKHMWERARAAQPDRHLSLAVVKMRMARAAELGMGYADYAALYRTAGRDPAGLLFTPAALHLRLKRRLEIPDPVRAHLARLSSCHLLALAPEGEHPRDFLDELREVSNLPFAAAAAMPPPGALWPDLVSAIRALLDPLRLPGTAIALIGAAASEARLCDSLVTAGRLAGHLDRDTYFRPASVQTA